MGKDPAPRRVADDAIVAMFTAYAQKVGAILSQAMRDARIEVGMTN